MKRCMGLVNSLRPCSLLTLVFPLCLLLACSGESSPAGSNSTDGTTTMSSVVTGAGGGVGTTTTVSTTDGGTSAATGTSSSGGVGMGGGPSTAAVGGSGGQGASTSVGGATSTGTGTAGTGGGSSVAGQVRWVGRVDTSDPDAIRFAWQGSGFIAYVSGDEVAVTLRTEGTDTVYFQPVVDGVAGERFNVDQGADRTITLATNLGAGMHVVELYRETEGYYGVSTFLGFASGNPMGAPPSSGRMLEVVGDSISAGYGNLGVELHPDWVANPACHWTAENSSWYLTYAALAGRALGADVSTIARSGFGMYRDLAGNTQGVLSSVYHNTLGFESDPPWSFEAQVDAVVINLGTNDWSGGGDPGMAYETAYLEFIAELRSLYPEAWIFLSIGSMLNEPDLSQVTAHLDNIVAQVQSDGDQQISAFDFGSQDLGPDGSIPSGCDWHPSAQEHARMAGVLEGELKSKLGW